MSDKTPSTPGSQAIINYKNQETAVQEFKVPASRAKKKSKPKILTEEKYIEELSKIIQRDFFPDLEKLKAQNEYLEAESRNDFAEMAAIKAKYTARRPPTNNPGLSEASFDTPASAINESPFPATRDQETSDTPCSNISSISKTSSNKKKSLSDSHSLDSFLQKYTSEDNQSFEEIIETAEEKLKQKFAILYNQEKISAEQLARALTLPSIEKQFDKPDPARPIETWNYTNKNSIMYIPDGVELTREEQIEAAAKKQIVQHCATRLSVNPFNDASSKKAVDDIAETHSQALSDKVGVDGNILHNNKPLPQVKGYDLLATPSPRPGEDFSPLMTWGEIEGTPFLLDGSNTPYVSNSGPSFRITENSRRETIALKLAEKAGEKLRAQKQKALDAARKNVSSPFIRSNMERLASMSPAARRLATTKLGLRTPLLTPSPSTSKRPSKSSFLTPTPGLSLNKTTPSVRSSPAAGVLVKTPQRPRSPSTPRISNEDRPAKSTITTSGSLTDDLHKIIPVKRMRATDFF